MLNCVYNGLTFFK